MKTNRIFVAIVGIAFAMTASAQNTDVEFSNSMQAAKLNYGHIKKEVQPHQDIVEAFIGNDPEPTILYSEDIHGWYIDGYGQFGTFAGNTTWGAGAGVGYRGRHWGSDIRVTFRRAYEDVESDRQAMFNQGQLAGRLHYNIIEWNNHHDVISLFGECSLQLSSFLKEQAGEYSYSSTNPDGSTTITTTTIEDLDARQFTIGFKAGAEYEHKFKFSPFSLILGGGFGRQQNIVLNTNKWYNQSEIYAGIRVRINQHKKYNDAALQQLGMTRADVWGK